MLKISLRKQWTFEYKYYLCSVLKLEKWQNILEIWLEKLHNSAK